MLSYEPDTDFGIWALWPWPWKYDLGSSSWHILGSWTISVWNIIVIQFGSEELWPGHGFWVCVHCDLNLGDMTLGQVHDTPLGHRQQLFEILSRLDKWVQSYGPDMMWTGRQTDGQGDSYPITFLKYWCDLQLIFLLSKNFQLFVKKKCSLLYLDLNLSPACLLGEI